MEGFRRGWRIPVFVTALLIVVALMLGGAQCPQVGTRRQPAAPRPTRLSRPAPVRQTRPGPTSPTTGDMTGSIQRTRRFVESGDWAGARRATEDVGSAWQPIRAGRWWAPSDMTAFEGAYTKLRAAIAAKDKRTALSALDQLSRLAGRNASRGPTTRPGPTTPGVRVRGTTPRVAPRTMTAPRR